MCILMRCGPDMYVCYLLTYTSEEVDRVMMCNPTDVGSRLFYKLQQMQTVGTSRKVRPERSSACRYDFMGEKITRWIDQKARLVQN